MPPCSLRPGRSRPPWVLAVAAAALGASCSAPGGSGGAPGSGIEWTPSERLDPPYVADPRRARFGISAVKTDSELDQAGGERVGLEVGGRVDIARYRPAGDPEGGLQLSVDAGYLGDFDREDSLDNLGWSGTYAVQVDWLAGRRLALRLGFGHESSHVGDEYLLETGRPRVNYTRDELRLGASFAPTTAVRLYAEYGHAVHLGNDSVQERGRGQLGAEWSSSELVAGAAGLYAATDLSGFEEHDWEANLALQAGWAIPRGIGRGTWRFALMGYDGRSPIGELADEEETRVALGVLFDL